MGSGRCGRSGHCLWSAFPGGVGPPTLSPFSFSHACHKQHYLTGGEHEHCLYAATFFIIFRAAVTSLRHCCRVLPFTLDPPVTIPHLYCMCRHCAFTLRAGLDRWTCWHFTLSLSGPRAWDYCSTLTAPGIHTQLCLPSPGVMATGLGLRFWTQLRYCYICATGPTCLHTSPACHLPCHPSCPACRPAATT